MFTRREAISTASAALAAAALPPRAARAADPATSRAPQDPQDDHRIWLNRPAESPLDMLVVGNGRLGAMVAGQPRLETIHLNEDTLWSGQPGPFEIGDKRGALDEVRRAVFAEDYESADRLCKQIQGRFSESYAPLADLHLTFDLDQTVGNYSRTLDLDEAVATVTYAVGDAQFTREVLVSHPAQLVLIRLRSSQPGGLNLALRLDSQLRHDSAADPRGITVEGKAPTYCAPSYEQDVDPVIYAQALGKGMCFATRLEVLSTDGVVSAEGETLSIKGAGEVVLAVSAATGFRGFDRAPDASPAEVLLKALAPLAAARTQSFAALRAAHVADHQSLYRRVSLKLGRAPSSPLATDARLAAVSKAADPSLAALYFNFSRYLLIASSRPGTQAANLQGVWSWQMRPPWSSNYTTNINIQENYWGAESGALPELAGPMIDFIEEVATTGAETASKLYGMRGWCVHHNSDLWRLSTPVGKGVGGPTWANFALAGPWLARHVWEHYLYNPDREFLAKRGYPLLKGCAEFCADWLVRDPRTGRLTTAPSVSTENAFRSADGKSHAVSAGCTMDIALIREIFTFTREAAAVLGVDADFAKRLKELDDQLPPYQIGRHGQLQEWAFDFEEPEPGQRHISHLYPVSPGSEITPWTHPALAKAAGVSMQRRLAAGGGGTGWGLAWAIHVFARLGDGPRAAENLRRLLGTSTTSALLNTLPSDSGPLFQIDGNFAGGAAVMEMLLQSHGGVIAFLPACPAEWSEGALSGARVRGGMSVDMSWSRGKLLQVTLNPTVDGDYLIRSPAGQRLMSVRSERKRAPFQDQNGRYRLSLKGHRRYELNFG